MRTCDPNFDWYGVLTVTKIFTILQLFRFVADCARDTPPNQGRGGVPERSKCTCPSTEDRLLNDALFP